jgi:hypothetical protein
VGVVIEVLVEPSGSELATILETINASSAAARPILYDDRLAQRAAI